MPCPRWVGIAGSTRFVLRGSPERTGGKEQKERLSRFASLRVLARPVVGEQCYVLRSGGVSKELVLVRAQLQEKVVYLYLFRLTTWHQGCQTCTNTRQGQVWSKHDWAVCSWQSSLFLGWSSCWWPSQPNALNEPQHISTALLCESQKVLRFLLGKALCSFPFLFHWSKSLSSLPSLNWIARAKLWGSAEENSLSGFSKPHQDSRLTGYLISCLCEYLSV